jgi:hypothetical protein
MAYFAQYSFATIHDLMTPAIHSMVGSSQDKSIFDARIQIEHHNDRVVLEVAHRYPLMTRYDMDSYGHSAVEVSRFLTRRALKFLGHDPKPPNRAIILSRHRMNVRAREARNGKKRRINRRDARRH